MPELPEVETTRRGLTPHVTHRTITEVRVYESRLRWPVPENLGKLIRGQTVTALQRRAKYLIVLLEDQGLLIHLGMSGSLRIVEDKTPRQRHDHIDWLLDSGQRLRYNDPRRFGSVLLLTQYAPPLHPLLGRLGPEPLDQAFNGKHLYRLSRNRNSSVKTFLMDQAIVVGVGNIYANEALFKAGIRPDRAAGRISLERYERLADEVKKVLSAAIEMGGTTLRDFVGGDGKPGYFQQTLNVYGRGGAPCMKCGAPLEERRLGQRTTVFCKYCQR